MIDHKFIYRLVRDNVPMELIQSYTGLAPETILTIAKDYGDAIAERLDLDRDHHIMQKKELAWQDPSYGMEPMEDDPFGRYGDY